MSLSADDAKQKQACSTLSVIEAFIYTARTREGIQRQVYVLSFWLLTRVGRRMLSLAIRKIFGLKSQIKFL